MKRDLALARAQEQHAISLEPPRLPPHLGDAHAQTALESDLVYHRLVLAALTLAFFAGTGFGRLTLHPGASMLSAVLWAATAAGLAARCLGARAAWLTEPVRQQVERIKALCVDYGVQDWRPLLRGDRMARLEDLRATDRLAPEAVAEIRTELERLTTIGEQAAAASLAALRRLAGLVALFGTLGSIGSAASGVWQPGVGALVVAGLLWLMAQHREIGRLLGIAVIAGIGIAVPWASAAPNAAIDWPAEAAGIGCAAAMIVLARDPLGAINVPQAFARIVAIGWAYSTLRAGAADLPHSLFVLAAGAAIVALDIHFVRRPSFIQTIATAMFLQLAAAPPGPTDPHAALWVQIPAAIIVFALLIAAGYRHALAAMLRLPSRTYRRAPRCIVPRLDETWDHPVEIYVV